jgi:hypothetical protein
MNYKVEKKTVEKLTITISRQQMWYNYMAIMADLFWDDTQVDMINDQLRPIMDVLCYRETPLNRNDLIGLFRKGYCINLLFNVKEITELKTRDVVLEVIVTDGVNQNIVISDSDIVI